MNERFNDECIIPRAAIYCRTSKVFRDTDVAKYLFHQLTSSSVALFYVITQWPLIQSKVQGKIVDEAIKSLGGTVTGIEPVKPKALNTSASGKPVEVVACSSCKLYLSFNFILLDII